MEEEEKIKCHVCGKRVYLFELGDATNCICYDCTEKMNTSSVFRLFYKSKVLIKKLFDNFLLCFSFLLGIVIFISVIVFWIGGCVGNFLNVDESPSPGLHWKPD